MVSYRGFYASNEGTQKSCFQLHNSRGGFLGKDVVVFGFRMMTIIIAGLAQRPNAGVFACRPPKRAPALCAGAFGTSGVGGFGMMLYRI